VRVQDTGQRTRTSRAAAANGDVCTRPGGCFRSVDWTTGRMRRGRLSAAVTATDGRGCGSRPQRIQSWSGGRRLVPPSRAMCTGERETQQHLLSPLFFFFFKIPPSLPHSRGKKIGGGGIGRKLQRHDRKGGGTRRQLAVREAGVPTVCLSVLTHNMRTQHTQSLSLSLSLSL
jgi:hypothetical protein